MLGVDLRAARYTWTAALVLLLLAVVYLIREALLVFVIALLFAYLLYPLMDLIDRHIIARNLTKTRTPALAVTFLLVLGILLGFGIPIGSVVASEASSLTTQAPALLARIEQPPAPSPSGVQTLKERAIEFGQAQLREHYGDLALAAPRLGMKILSASGSLIYVIIVPILSFLILRDGRNIRDGFLEMLDSGQQAARDVLADAHELLLSYMRALLFLCCATFVSFSIVLSAMGVPYAVLLASIAFPLEFIPLVGPLSAAVIIIAVSILSGYAHVIWVVVYLGLYRLFQDYVLSPHLMSRGVELHPLMIIFGVFAGGKLGGVAGIFLSIPILALIRLFYHRARKAQAARHLQPAA
ncbi:MAG TPA: AI-2E family transporter [Bryobacteraceae bacterium]|jgi:predicted PurR-regulated permease PerM|nr:AI-2E family transporter [Bryobacteraceae bacterium]